MTLNLRALAQFLRDVCRACRPPTDDLTAVMDATAEPTVEVAQMHREPTPLADAAMDFLRRSMSELDGMDDVADFLYLCGEES